MQVTFTTGLDHLAPQELGHVHGRLFAEHAVAFRLRGLPVETWTEFMHHRLASLAKRFTTQEAVDAWAKALNEAYLHALDNDMDTLMLQAHNVGREH